MTDLVIKDILASGFLFLRSLALKKPTHHAGGTEAAHGENVTGWGAEGPADSQQDVSEPSQKQDL